jgi:hypothetical protein
VTSVWPDLPAATSPGQKIRDQLDYIVWVAEAIEPVGFHSVDELESWRRRVQRAYAALVDSMIAGHGDPLPPDIPPALRPGTWPDVAAAAIPGMTIRHQLAVIRKIAAHTREDRQFPHSPGDVSAWGARVQAAYDALDHGPAIPMPKEARTEPPQPPPSAARPSKPARRASTPSKPARAAAKGASRSKRPAHAAKAPRKGGKKR